MKNFISKTSKYFFVIAGIITSLAGILSVLPEFGMNILFKLNIIEENTILIQHWGMTIFLVGIFMIISAFKIQWRMPILLFASLEKIYFVLLYLINNNESYSKGFITGAISDSIISTYCIIYIIYEIKNRQQINIASELS